ncbi:hypothetical protein [Leucobacter soli]|uniref:hypothetical protein n=1 Tax=Leucobacter soli TaxID=2812850 RepID=UPI00360CE007
MLATDPDENAAIDVPTGTTGLRFVYENTAGLSQATYVKPNISFTARTHTRTAGSRPPAPSTARCATRTRRRPRARASSTPASSPVPTRIASTSASAAPRAARAPARAASGRRSSGRTTT